MQDAIEVAATEEVKEIMEEIEPNKGTKIDEENWSTIAKDLVAAGHKAPRNFWQRNMGCISPEKWYNHRSGKFSKNRRKGL